MSGDKLPEGVEILDYDKMSEGERFAHHSADLWLRIPVIAPTRSDASRPPVPTDRDQCEGAVRCTC